MKKRSISMVLVLLMCLSLFAGCQSSELKSLSEVPSASPSPEATAGKDYGPAFESYPADTVMMTIEGIDVTWAELFYWYANITSMIESSVGQVDDWNATAPGEEAGSHKDYVLENSLDTLRHYYALEAKAKELGVSVSAEELAATDAIWQSNIDNYGAGDEAKFLEYLEATFLTKEIFYHVSGISNLYVSVMAEMFGANGAKLSETEIVDEATAMGYVHANHILFSTVDAEGNALSEELKAEKKAQADKTLAELRALTETGTALDAKFKELAVSSSEDPGKAYYADGYTYLPSTMVAEFEAAATGLKDYEISEVVETTHGYHIILRLPLSATAAVEQISETEAHTLGYFVAEQMFGLAAEEWAEKANIEFSKEYNEMDLAAVLAKATVKAG